MKKLKFNLRELLYRRNMTQQALSDLTGIPYMTINYMCSRGTLKSINKEHLCKIAYVLDIDDISELLEFSDDSEDSEVTQNIVLITGEYGTKYTDLESYFRNNFSMCAPKNSLLMKSPEFSVSHLNNFYSNISEDIDNALSLRRSIYVVTYSPIVIAALREQISLHGFEGATQHVIRADGSVLNMYIDRYGKTSNDDDLYSQILDLVLKLK